MTSAQNINAQNAATTQIHPPAMRPFQVRACDECKRQKMKCSASVDYPNPCKRCQNRRQPCEFTGRFEKIIRRQQKRKQFTKELDQVYNSADPSSLKSLPTKASKKKSNLSDQPLLQKMVPDIDGRPRQQATDCNLEFSVPSLSSTAYKVNSTAENINSRVLQGIDVSATEINETFSLFFANYSHHLSPILDPNLSPDWYFAESPLLFWTIIVIGSRQYMQNPTLLSTLAAPVLELAWKSMMQTNEPISPVIESLVLLATWAFPLKTIFKDMTFTLSGMAMSLAIQVGFHVPKQAQAFTLKTVDSSEVSLSKRMNLWMNCLLCRFRSAASLGYPPTTLDLAKTALSVKNLSQYVPSKTIFQLQLLDLAAQATVAVLEMDGNVKSDNDDLNATLNVIEAKFSILELELTRFQDQERLHFHMARLQIRVYYVTTSGGHDFPDHVAMLYQDSINVIMLCGKLQESMQLCLSCPTYIWLLLGLAACALLKLLRSRSSVLKEAISLSEGRQAYFAAIALLKKTSIEPGDGPGRLAGALTQLWTSRRASEFTEAIGVDSPVDRRKLNSRLAMSLLYETLQWYRDEYGGQAFLTSLAPREPGLPHYVMPTNGTTLPQTNSSPMNDENFQFQAGDVDLEDPLFANWIPMTDDDFTAFAMFPSWNPTI